MTAKSFLLFCWGLVLLSPGCNKKEDNGDQVGDRPNILLIIADDMGLDATPSYDLGDHKPNMPNLSALIDAGLKFDHCWSNPTCTPTRGTILTGKYGFRTGVTQVGDEMPTTEQSIHDLFDASGSGYAHAVIGKWHLSGDAAHPAAMGVGHYAGMLNGAAQSYTNWNLTENGVTQTSSDYITTKLSDLAIEWLTDRREPWFLWLAYTAPHTPFHLPPAHLHTQTNLSAAQDSIDANPLPYYLAMLEALDTEMGRVLASLSAEERQNTIVIFIGDNGTPGLAAQAYNSMRAKGTLYQGGINVPLVISGKGVSRNGQTESALVNSSDLFATLAGLAGLDVGEVHDSRSLVPLLTAHNPTFRSHVYAEIGDAGSVDVAVRNATHKLIRFADGEEALYDLRDNALEKPNLLSPNQLPLNAEDQAAYNELLNQLAEIHN